MEHNKRFNRIIEAKKKSIPEFVSCKVCKSKHLKSDMWFLDGNYYCTIRCMIKDGK
jgi:hypothetical protein